MKSKAKAMKFRFAAERMAGKLLYWLFKHRLFHGPVHSWGIHEGPTCGYGKLDDNGYFQFPVYKEKP